MQDARFCSVCGQPQDEMNQQPGPAQWQPPQDGVNQQPDPAQWQPPQDSVNQQPGPAQWQPPQDGAYQQPAPTPWSQPYDGVNQQPGPAQWQYQQGGMNQQPNPYAQPVYQPVIPRICSITEIYSRVFSMLKQKPILMWGISLMYTLLSFIAFFVCLLPIIYIPVLAVLEFGMISVFLAGYRGQHFESAMLFTGFKDFKRIAGGMLWMTLWIFIWALIPIAGIVMAIIKSYAYRFVPYLLLTDPGISATDALKRSMEMTKGYKGKMFGADIIVGIIIGVAVGILMLLGLIPAVGFIFIFLAVIVDILCVIFIPLFMGLVSAAYFDEIERIKQ